MTNNRNTLLVACMLMFTAVATAATEESYGAGNRETWAVIASRSLPSDGISFGDLKRLYMGSAVTAGGKLLLPITYPKESAERASFDEAVLGMSAEETGLYWIDRKIRGQSGPPKSVASAATIVRVVNKVDGAIGFVRTNAVGKEVKILRIDGKLPNEPGYRL